MAAAKKAATRSTAKTEAEKEVKVAVPGTEAKKAAEKTEEKKAAGKKAAEKAEEKKATGKKAEEKKTPVKKAELKSAIHVQFSGKSYAEEDLVKIAKDVWKYDLKQKAGELESVELYVKPEENIVYYVMNQEFTGSFYI